MKKSMPPGDLVTSVAAELEEFILSGQWATGERLPTERQLCTQFGVSRSVVREALGRLASSGLVERLQGSGTRAVRPNGRQLTTGYQHMLRAGVCSLDDLTVVRLQLETKMAELAALHRTASHLEDLAREQAVMANSALPFETHIRADLAFHAVLAKASGNPLFEVVLRPIQELLIESRRRTVDRDGVDVAHADHAEIHAAVQKQDPQAAERAMRKHITRVWRGRENPRD